MKIPLSIVALCWSLQLCLPLPLHAQEAQSGGLDFGATWGHSRSEVDAFSLSGRAMAVDRFPGTVIGRFGDLNGHIGIDTAGEIMAYGAGLQLGVGVSSDYFTLFAASGFFFDAFESIDEASEELAVPTGSGIPLSFGLWLTPWSSLYIYAMTEARWVFGVEEREVESFDIFGFGEEFKLRGGLGFQLQGLHYRGDFQVLQVGSDIWYLTTLGIGPKPMEAEDLPPGIGGS